MVHWGYIVVALFLGVFAGVFLVAVLETAAREDEKNKRRGKWYDDL